MKLPVAGPQVEVQGTEIKESKLGGGTVSYRCSVIGNELTSLSFSAGAQTCRSAVHS